MTNKERIMKNAAEPDRDELLATLKLLFKAWDWNWIHPDERAQIYRQVLSVIQRAEGGE